MAVSFVVVFLYGSMVWGIFPIKEHISWEGHFSGGLAGIILAWWFDLKDRQSKNINMKLMKN